MATNAQNLFWCWNFLSETYIVTIGKMIGIHKNWLYWKLFFNYAIKSKNMTILGIFWRWRRPKYFYLLSTRYVGLFTSEGKVSIATFLIP